MHEQVHQDREVPGGPEPLQRREEAVAGRRSAGAAELERYDRALNQGPRLDFQRRMQAQLDAAPRQLRALSATGAQGADAPVQRISIAGQHVPPTGARGKELLNKVRLGLLDAGLSPHGSRNKFLEVAASSHQDFASDEQFVGIFVREGIQEAQRVLEERRIEKEAAKREKRKATTIRGWTRPLQVSRPAWPSSYKAASQPGFDIRHVVRNATMLNALQRERNYYESIQGEEAAAPAMAHLANAVGVGPADHSFETMMAVYRTAYLNRANLFPGPGAINRVIGLTADPITEWGTKLLTSNEFASPQVILASFGQIETLVKSKGAQVRAQAQKMAPAAAESFLERFEAFEATILTYLEERGDELAAIASRSPEDQEELMELAQQTNQGVLVGVTEAQIGRELIDVGANFGFDLPDDSLGPSHMEALLEAEEFLANYQPGQPGSSAQLARVLGTFMGAGNLLGV